jgi:hypothetical protein
MLLTAYSMLLSSPFLVVTSTSSLPFATAVSSPAAYVGSPPSCLRMLRVTSKAAPIANSTASVPSVIIMLRAEL